MTDEVQESQPVAKGSQILERQSLRFCTFTSGDQAPKTLMAATLDEALERLDKMVVQGTANEIHLFAYHSTVRAVTSSERVNIFEADDQLRTNEANKQS